jgi:hypothetical protein
MRDDARIWRGERKPLKMADLECRFSPLEDLSAQTQRHERYVVGVDLGQARAGNAIFPCPQ